MRAVEMHQRDSALAMKRAGDLLRCIYLSLFVCHYQAEAIEGEQDAQSAWRTESILCCLPADRPAPEIVCLKRSEFFKSVPPELRYEQFVSETSANIKVSSDRYSEECKPLPTEQTCQRLFVFSSNHYRRKTLRLMER